MRYKAGDKVKMISKERLDKMSNKAPSFLNYDCLLKLAGSEQTIDGITKTNRYVIKDITFTEDAIEGPAGPMDTDMIKAGQEKKYNGPEIKSLEFKGPLVAETFNQQAESLKKTAFETMIDEAIEKNKPSSAMMNATIQHSPYPFAKVKLGETEMVNHPAHYGGADNPYEVVKVIEAWGLDWHLGSAVKYIARAGKKDPAKLKEDLEKAMWYIQRKLSLLAVFMLLFCFSGFAQVDSMKSFKGDSLNYFYFDTARVNDTIVYIENLPNDNFKLRIQDKAGAWLTWYKDSDTLELIPPAKVHYIKVGKKVIRL